MMVAVLLGQYPQHRLFKQPSLPRGASLAQFEFAPASGAGMGTACACAIPTDARGNAGTYTRASAAWCSKQGLASTGIADGDLVNCTTNQPRIEPSGGVLGFRSEATRTNTLLHSQGLDNAAWVATGTGVAAPTVTANFATAPDGTTTAERLQVAACAGAGNVSAVVQSYTGTAAAWSAHTFIRGNGTSGNLTIALNDTTATAGTAISVAFDSSGWTWLGGPAGPLTRTFANTTHQVLVGCVNVASISGSANTGAADVLVWQAQSEAGAFPTSPITTTSAAATRAVDTGIDYTVPAIGPDFCLSSSVAFLGSGVGATNISSLAPNGTSEVALYRTSNTAAGYDIGGTVTAPTVSAMGTSVHRALLRDTAGTRAAFWNAGSVSAPADSMLVASTTVRVGAGPNSGSPGNTNGIVTLVQADNDTTRCTP